MGQFQLSPLRGDRILQAYPLVRASGGALSIEEWRAYVKAMLGTRARDGHCCDIVGIRSTNGYLRGMCTYHAKPDLHHGRTLDVEYFVLESVYSPREIISVLKAGVENEARKLGCNAIHAKTPVAKNWLSEMLEARDYSNNTRMWCKRAD